MSGKSIELAAPEVFYFNLNGAKYVIDLPVLQYIDKIELERWEFEMLSKGWKYPKEGDMPKVGLDVFVWTNDDEDPKKVARCSNSNTWYFQKEHKQEPKVLFWSYM